MTTLSARGSVALSSGGPSTVQLTGPVPDGRAYALFKVILTGGDSTIVVAIEDDQNNVGFYADYITDTPLTDSGEGYHFQAGRTISLVASAGTGTLFFTVIFKLI